MGWRVIDLTGFEGKLGYQRGHLKVIRSGATDPTLINLKQIGVILCGSHVSISGGLLVKLSDLGIPLLITDWKNVPVGALQSWSQHTRVGARQIAQSQLSLPRAKSAWASIVKAKVIGQSQVQQVIGHAAIAGKLQELAKSVRSGDPANIEGHAAQLHWRNFSQSIRFTRNHKSTDPLNSCLNYGYTILRGFCIRSVLEAGLWPALGVFHHGRSNAFNLVDDFIEPFRPVVDYLVTQLPEDCTLGDPNVKKHLAGAAETVFLEDGSVVSTVMTDMAQRFGRYVEGDLQKFKSPVWSGPLALESK